MHWRDIRFEKPTEADADKHGRILQLLESGRVVQWSWHNLTGSVAWMPTSELPAFTPIPDPPEGWRFVEKGEAFDKRAKYWGLSNHWVETLQEDGYAKELVYIVPIDPPEPQYRPFANAAEFDGWATLFWRYKEDSSDTRRSPMSYSDQGHFGDSWKVALDEKVFSDGSPFGVKVDP
jgi:hypothetical protein